MACCINYGVHFKLSLFAKGEFFWILGNYDVELIVMDTRFNVTNILFITWFSSAFEEKKKQTKNAGELL